MANTNDVFDDLLNKKKATSFLVQRKVRKSYQM